VTPAQKFEALRAKFVSDLEATSSNLATARATLIAAEAVHGEARTVWQDLNALLAAGHRSESEGTPAPLRHEILNSDESSALDAAKSTRGAALAVIKNLEHEVRELQLSIEHVDRSLTSVKVTHLPRPTTEQLRRKPAPVDYDNITMPREAAS
jgi:hypothetical protein